MPPQRLSLLALIPVSIACGAEPDSTRLDPLRDGAGVGTLRASLVAPNVSTDVDNVRFVVTSPGLECSTLSAGDVVAESTAPLRLEPAPQRAESALAEELFLVPVGAYRVCALPLQGSGVASAVCSPGYADVAVSAEQAEDAAIVIQCTPGTRGVLGVSASFNSPPLIENVEATPGRHVGECQNITLSASVSDADGDALEVAWEIASGTGGVLLPLPGSAVEFQGAPGDYQVRVTATDSLQESTSLTVPLSIAAQSCGEVSAIAFDGELVGTSATIPLRYGEDTDLLPIGFEFEYFGRKYDTLRMSWHGYLKFIDAALESVGRSSGEIHFTEGSFHDFNLPIPVFNYETRGAAPNRRFILRYSQPVAPVPSSSYAQTAVKLFEGSNVIEVHTIAANGTRGPYITNETGTRTLGSRDYVSFRAREAIRFTTASVD